MALVRTTRSDVGKAHRSVSAQRHAVVYRPVSKRRQGRRPPQRSRDLAPRASFRTATGLYASVSVTSCAIVTLHRQVVRPAESDGTASSQPAVAQLRMGMSIGRQRGDINRAPELPSPTHFP